MMFFKTNKNKIILVLVSAILLVIMALSTLGEERASIVDDTFGAFLTPVEAVFNYVADSINYGNDKAKYKDENIRLKTELADAKQKANRYDKIEKENASLKAMLELTKSTGEFKYKAAEVIGIDSVNWSNTLRLNRGIRDGIKKNDTVVTEVGLVGYVSAVGRNWAEVTTIIDTETSVSAVVDRIDEYCMIQGEMSLFDKNLCAMKYASSDSAVSIGDILTTSGDGGIFPDGINIGKISEISADTNGISQDAIIEPFVDFEDLDTVLVIIGQ